MQRTMLYCTQGDNTTYNGTGAVVSYYGPMGGPNPVNPLCTSTVGTGAFGKSAWAAVYSKLYMTVGQVNSASPTCTGNINTGGSPNPGAGNLTCVSNGAQSLNPVYYYDATDIDAITASQGVGFMNTLSAVSGGIIVMPTMAVACDTLNQGFCSPFLFNTKTPQNVVQTIYNAGPKYSHINGTVSNGATTVTPAQGYSQQGFVASYLQWQSLSQNTDTASSATCTFAYGATFGSPADSSLHATISDPSGGYVLSLDATDVVAVPAGSYFNFHWSGSTNQNTLYVGNAGVHLQAAASNSTWLGAGAVTQATWPTQTPSYCPFGTTRFDYKLGETMSTSPTAGVFSGLAVEIAAYTATATFAMIWAQAADTGGGSGSPPTSGGDSQTPGFNASSLSVTASSRAGLPYWLFDATDILAVTRTTPWVLEASSSTFGNVQTQAQAINFTAPAHLGLTTVGAG